MKIQTKLTLLLIILAATVLAAAGIFSMVTLEKYFNERTVEELKTYSNEIEYTIRTFTGHEAALYEHIQELAHSADLRLTLIENSGEVVFESDLPKDKLKNVENHIDRPEIESAVLNGFGTDRRRSSTLKIDMLYLAKKITLPFPPDSPFRETKFLRIGIPLGQVRETMNDIRSKIIVAGVLLLLLVTITSFLISKKVTSPIRDIARIASKIQSGNLAIRIQLRSNDELGDLGKTLNGMIDKLNEDISKLRKLEQMRSEFLGNVSHELRTPVFAIVGMLETLLRGALDDEHARKIFVERALANTQRLGTLLNDLIDISRIETGDMKLSFRYFPLVNFIDQIVAEMKPLADESRVTLIIDNVDENIEVYGDKERLKQVMVNLIHNAVKYNTPEGSVTISASRNESGVKISLHDTGVGISPEHLPRIFERFYRIDKERSREAGGTGLGLAIVKHIIEAHGSNVEVHSEIGKGSTFSFSLKI